MSEAICERPPELRTIAVLGGLEFDGEGADQAGQDAAGANSGKVAAHIVGLLVIRREGGGHRRRLHDADHGNHQGQRHQVAQFIGIGEGR